MKNGTENVRILMISDFKLLHYKFWNIDHYMKRMAEYQTRMSKENEVYNWGWHYMLSMSDHYHMFTCACDLAKPLFEITVESPQPLNLDIKT